jgi:uncharacterized lipoprotein YddW (UPF0748 family)
LLIFAAKSISTNKKRAWKMRILLFLVLVGCLCCGRQPVSEASTAAVPVRGVWLTNIDSEALFSREGIREAVAVCKQYGFNTIFTVTWNRGYTLYPSKLMETAFGIPIDPAMAGRDPLQELIEEAQAAGIRVFAWFEFGFSCSYQEPDGGHLLRQRPHWAAIGSDGQLVTKNGFQWMNAFDPEVQDFILGLLLEVAANYAVDGIQGDDRLPALPSEAGYDSLTVALYRAAHQGARPPADHLDSAWVDWRAQRLNAFMARMHQSLKAQNPAILLSASPSIYPWSKEQYLQDWPTWVREGWVDLVCPQIYRYDIDKYRLELHKIVSEQLPPDKLGTLSPGILLKVGDYVAADTFLAQMVQANREQGLAGEVFFFFEGLKLRPSFFEKLYEH